MVTERKIKQFFDNIRPNLDMQDLCIDGLGYLLIMELTIGQVLDGKMMQICSEQIDISGSIVLTEKVYGS